jgi:hypothetical protein
LADRGLEGVSTSHKLCALGGRSLPRLAFGGSLSLERSHPLLERCAPGVRITLKGLSKEHQCCELRTQRPRLFAPRLRPSDTTAESRKLPAQFFVFHQRRAGIATFRHRHPLGQRDLSRRRRAVYRGCQPGDVAKEIGLRVDPHAPILPPNRIRVNAIRELLMHRSTPPGHWRREQSQVASLPEVQAIDADRGRTAARWMACVLPRGLIRRSAGRAWARMQDLGWLPRLFRASGGAVC